MKGAPTLRTIYGPVVGPNPTARTSSASRRIDVQNGIEQRSERVDSLAVVRPGI